MRKQYGSIGHAKVKWGPFFAFYGLSCFFSWLIWLPLYGPRLGIKGLPVLPLHHGLGGLGPLLAAVTVTAITGSRRELAEFLKQFVQVKPAWSVAVALLAPFVLLGVAVCIDVLTGGQSPDWHWIFTSKDIPQAGLSLLFAYNLVFFGFGEEAGWRGFALPRLQTRFGALTSAALLTLFWAVWHLPLFMYRPGYADMGLAGATGWLFSLLTGSILQSWLYNSSRGSVLVCAIFHSTIDVVFTADIANTNIVNYLGAMITIWGVATVLVYGTRHLGREARVVMRV